MSAARILVIEDNTHNIELVDYLLRAHGYVSLLARDGLHGIRIARAQRPDLILLDIRMPEMDGFEVNRRLRQTPGLADTPVIFLSAHAQETTRQDSLAAGGRYFLPKPYEVKSLIAAIRAVLKGGVATRGIVAAAL
jgi:CheY-like chemotaxis protein